MFAMVTYSWVIFVILTAVYTVKLWPWIANMNTLYIFRNLVTQLIAITTSTKGFETMPSSAGFVCWFHPWDTALQCWVRLLIPPLRHCLPVLTILTCIHLFLFLLSNQSWVTESKAFLHIWQVYHFSVKPKYIFVSVYDIYISLVHL